MTHVKRKVRPSTASGIIQSSRITNIVDDFRPNTSIGKKEPTLGLEPTYITSDLQISHKLLNSKYTGKQVHGGVNENNLKNENGRRATIGPTDDIFQEKIMRPFAAPSSVANVKV